MSKDQRDTGGQSVAYLDGHDLPGLADEFRAALNELTGAEVR